MTSAFSPASSKEDQIGQISPTSAFPMPLLDTFGRDVDYGLSSNPKQIPAEYVYDDIGLALLETIAKVPGPGMAQAEIRILQRNAAEIAHLVNSVCIVTKLGNESRRATSLVVRSLSAENSQFEYLPLPLCQASDPNSWLDGVEHISAERKDDRPLLLLLLGRLFGTLDDVARSEFLTRLRAALKPGDFLLVGADLVKDSSKLLAYYDDSLGLMAALNRNLLARVNRDLGGHFNLRAFRHRAKWNAFLRRVELHLESCEEQDVYISAIRKRFSFVQGETIQTESAYKLSELELEGLASATGFTIIKTWIDLEFLFAETLWTV